MSMRAICLRSVLASGMSILADVADDTGDKYLMEVRSILVLLSKPRLHALTQTLQSRSIVRLRLTHAAIVLQRMRLACSLSVKLPEEADALRIIPIYFLSNNERFT